MKTSTLVIIAMATLLCTVVAYGQAQKLVLTNDEAVNNIGVALNGWIQFAPTTEAERKAVADSFNQIKAAMQAYQTLTEPPKEAIAATPEAPVK